MKKIQKSLFAVMFSALLFFIPFLCVKAAAVAPAKIKFVGVEHSPIIEGDSETFLLSSEGTGLVQYRIFFYTASTNTWKELTKGYSSPVQGNVPFSIKPDSTFKPGSYKLSIWGRRANVKGVYSNSNGDYDSYMTSQLTCVAKNEGINLAGDVDVSKNTYTVGEVLTINGIKDIGGSEGQYSYKLHAYSLDENKWLTNLTEYKDKIELRLDKPGRYVLDIWVKSKDSNNQYDGWKLFVIDVKENKILRQDPVNVVTVIGQKPNLPDVVSVYYDDGTTNGCHDLLDVEWNTISPTSYSKEGTFKVTGKLKNSSFAASATVKVEMPSKIAKVTFVGLEHYPVLNGGTETFYLTSTGSDMVQYRIFFYTPSTNKWAELTNGYTQAVKSSEPYIITPPTTFKPGEYKISVWVKRAGQLGVYSNSNGDFDGYMTSLVSCKDNNGAINLAGDMIIKKDTYKLGEKISILGVENAGQSSMLYKVHLYDCTQNKWIKDVTGYSKTPEWTPTKPGTYIIDLWAKDAKSTLQYDGWKLKIINVVNENYVDAKGNTPGNLLNAGFAAADENYLYYSAITDEEYTGDESIKHLGGLYRRRLDGTGSPERITGYTYASHINVVGDYVYFTNEVNCIVKVIKDGSEEAKVLFTSDGSIDYLYVDENNVYFSCEYKGIRGLYRLENGLPVILIPMNSTYPLKNFYFVDDCIYYTDSDKGANPEVNKLYKRDYKGNISLVSDMDIESFAITSKYLYCLDKNQNLYKIDLATNKSELVTEDLVSSINTIDNNLYFVDEYSRLIYMVDEAGNINDTAASENLAISKLYYINGNLFYNSVNTEIKSGYISKDSADKNEKWDSFIISAVEVDNYLYYVNSTDGDIYKKDLTNNTIVNIGGKTIDTIVVNDGWVYFSNIEDGGKLYRVKTDGTYKTKLTENFVSDIAVKNGYVYFINLDEGNCIERVPAAGGSKTTITQNSILYYGLNDSGVYYYIEGDTTGVIHRVNFDGTGDKIILNDVICNEIKSSNNDIYFTGMLDDQFAFELYKINSLTDTPSRVGVLNAIYFDIYNDNIYYMAVDNDGNMKKINVTDLMGNPTNTIDISEGQCIHFIPVSDGIYYNSMIFHTNNSLIDATGKSILQF